MPPSSAVASIRLTAEHSQLAHDLRASAGVVREWAQSTRNAMSSVANAPGNALLGIIKAGASVAQFKLATRGLDFMVEASKDVFDFERKLTRLGIAARIGKDGLDQVRKAARETAVTTGVDASVVLDSARAYVDLAGAQNSSIEKMRILARAGQASEAEGKDLAGMMYQLTRSMKVADDQMEDTMGGLINQAKDGAIEAKQMASEFAGMMPIFARFGVVGREGAIQLGAMYQVTRDGFDSAAQAATGMIRLMAGFQRHASRFEKFGVQVFKPGSKRDLRDLSDIMDQVKKSPLSKDIEALIRAFGRSEAWRTAELLAEAPDRLKELEQAGRENGVIAKDLATMTESASGRIDIAIQKMKSGFAELLTPERIDQIVSGIGQIANAMPALMHAIARVADGFGAFVHMVTRAKARLVGDSKYKTTDREQALLEGLQNEKEGRRVYWTPAERAEAMNIKKRKADYDAAIGEIMGLEDDFGPTDASIKKAIQYGRSWQGTGMKMPGDTASISYLNGRDRDISTLRYKRLEAEVQAEDKAKMAVFGFSPTEKYETKLAGESVRRIASAIATAVGLKPNVLTVDGNPVAKAGGNATDRRRK